MDTNVKLSGQTDIAVVATSLPRSTDSRLAISRFDTRLRRPRMRRQLIRPPRTRRCVRYQWLLDCRCGNHEPSCHTELTMTIRLLLLVCGLLLWTPRTVLAQSCMPFLGKVDNAAYSGVMVTLNKNGVASASYVTFAFQAVGKAFLGGTPRYQFVSPGDAPQFFSDRTSGPQMFDQRRPDQIRLSITQEASPLVTVTLRSWGNQRSEFRATCSAGGVLHGSTPDVDYLLKMSTVVIG